MRIFIILSFPRLPVMAGMEGGRGFGDYSVAMAIGRSGGMGRKKGPRLKW